MPWISSSQEEWDENGNRNSWDRGAKAAEQGGKTDMSCRMDRLWTAEIEGIFQKIGEEYSEPVYKSVGQERADSAEETHLGSERWTTHHRSQVQALTQSLS